MAGSGPSHETPPRAGRTRRLAVLLAASVLATLGLGTAKLVVQRHHPPPYAGPERNTYEGFVSVDQYCVRAERFGAWLAGEEGARAALARDLAEEGHPFSLAVPLAIAVLARAVGSIPIAFALLSAAAFVLQVALVAGLARRLGADAAGAGRLPVGATRSGAARTTALAAGVLVAAHVDSARTAVQLLLDPFAACLGTASVLVALERARGRRLGPLLLAVQAAGTFVKISWLPFLAAPALVALVTRTGARRRSAVADGLLFGLLPLAPAALYVLAGPGGSVLTHEMGQAAGMASLSPPALRNLAVEAVLLLQAFPLVLLIARRPLSTPSVAAVLAMAALFLVAIGALLLPDHHRLHLPALGLLAAGTAPSVVLFAGRRLVPALALYAAANAALALAGLLAQV